MEWSETSENVFTVYSEYTQYISEYTEWRASEKWKFHTFVYKQNYH